MSDLMRVWRMLRVFFTGSYCSEYYCHARPLVVSLIGEDEVERLVERCYQFARVNGFQKYKSWSNDNLYAAMKTYEEIKAHFGIKG